MPSKMFNWNHDVFKCPKCGAMNVLIERDKSTIDYVKGSRTYMANCGKCGASAYGYKMNGGVTKDDAVYEILEMMSDE